MLKKMRRRFILAAMAAFGTVMLVLVAGINIVSYVQMAASQDKMLDEIYSYHEMTTSRPEQEFPPISDMPWAGGPETEFTQRFFVVRCDEAGNVLLFARDYISSIDEDTAQSYTREILDRQGQRGYYRDYRYLVEPEDQELTIVFLNVADALQSRQAFLLISLLVGVFSMLVVFGLVLIFSRGVIRSYEKNVQRQKRFITDAGHELKTPLTSIATSADIAAMEYEGDEWIANIQKQTGRLTKLVNDLVTLSRLDEEMPFPEKTSFSLSEAAWEIAEPFAALARANGKKYRQQIQEGIDLYGDRSAVQQMLSILLDNAVRYSDAGGDIRLDICSKHGKIYMEVFNTCAPLGSVDLSCLFDRFYRPDESRSTHTGGSGIGLSIAQAVAENHGGHITVSSSDGKSILFRVVL